MATSGLWMGFVEVVVTVLVYGIGVILLGPILGRPARMLVLPLIGYWGLRRGMIGGLAAAVLSQVFVLPLILGIAGLKPDQPSSVPFILGMLAIIGFAVGRMSDLGKQLRSELAAREQAEASLREEQTMFRIFFEGCPYPMWIFDDETLRFVAVNQAKANLYGYTTEEFRRMNLADIQVPENLPSLRSFIDHLSLNPADIRIFDRRHRRKDGSIIEVEIVSQRITYQGRPCRLGLATDVTEQRKARAALEHQANHDAMTGLPNRAAFESSLNRAVDEARQTSRPFGLFLVDLDRFKEINDTLGHSYGDLVLQQIGPRLRCALREKDILARLGGDEFAILLPGADSAEAARVGARLLATFHEPFVFEGRRFDVGASIGVVTHPDHGDGDPATLLRLADSAMYAAKRHRGGVVIYRPGLEDAAHRPIDLAIVAIEPDPLIVRGSFGGSPRSSSATHAS